MWYGTMARLLAQVEGNAAEGAAAANGAEPESNLLTSIAPWFPFIIIGVLMYLIILRPQRRKQAAMDLLLNNLKKNDRVVTIGGIMGTIVNVTKDSDEITIRVDENTNTRMRILRSAVRSVVQDKPESSSAD